MSDRRLDAFFYGLFMDLEVLRESGVTPVNPRRARLQRALRTLDFPPEYVAAVS